MRHHILPLALAILVTSSVTAFAQGSVPQQPQLSLTGAMWTWLPTQYPDGRIWTSRGSAEDTVLLHVPVWIRNCWTTIDDETTFPITSFTIPVQYDSGALEFVEVDGSGHATNFEYSFRVDEDTSYYTVQGAPSQLNGRGRRVTITGQAAGPEDTLNPTSSSAIPCDQFPMLRMFTLIFRVKADGVNDPASLRTPLIIATDSLRYNSYSVNDPVWNIVPRSYQGLGGTDNFYFDAAAYEQCRDILRPSRPGMMWVEVVDSIPSLSWGDLDTVTIHIKPSHTWADTLSGKGYVDVVFSNSVTRSRATNITVETLEPWMRFRSISNGAFGGFEPISRPTRIGTIPYLDLGILGDPDLRTPMGDVTAAQPPFTLRIFGNNTMLSGGGRFVGAISFESPSMRPARVELPVVLIISDSVTSVDVQGASTSYASSTISVAPNPSDGVATLTVRTETSASVDIVAVDGRIVDTFTLNHTGGNAVHHVAVSALPSGVYRAVVRTREGVTSVGFVVTP